MKIQRDSFLKAWETLEKRFGKQPPGSAMDYLAYLTPLLTEQEFREGWSAVWATREFFPRPADFLLVRQGHDWAKVQVASEMARKKEDWSPIFQSMTPQGQLSIKAMGGIFVIEERMQKGPAYVRKDFGNEYEMAVTTLAIGPGKKVEELPEVTPESRMIVGQILEDTK